MKLLKLLIVIFSINLIMISCSDTGKDNPASPEDEKSTLKWLSTSGARIVDSDGEPVVLRGVNRSGLEYDMAGNGIDEVEIEYIVDEWDANIFRIPFNQQWIMMNESYNDKLDNVIRWIKGRGAYVILDLQWRDTIVKIPPIPDEEAVEMWIKLAKRYKDEPAVLYDIHNEAHDISITSWRTRAIEIIEGIRSVHTKSLIMVSGLDWANDVSAWAQNPLPYNNIVYDVHKYPWSSPKERWNSQFGNYVDQIPIFVGEFGGEEKDLEWGKELISYLYEKELGWTAWSWVDYPQLTLTDKRTPTEFGELVKTSLNRYANPEAYSLDIYDIQVKYIGSDKATIFWRTTMASDSRVTYGLTNDYTDSVYAAAMLEVHTMKLNELQADTEYHFKVISEDQYGLKSESNDSTFTTLSE